MKLVALWLASVGCALAAGCSVSHRSDEFACDTQAQCSSGRTCIDHVCVVPDDAGIPDGPHADAAVCPSQCTSCSLDQKSCTIDCALNGGCRQAISCPTGFSCNVLCSQEGGCDSGVSCTGSTSCTITCSGRQSCQSVSCGLGPCNITCSGSGSCAGPVTCGLSCACDVTCRLAASCNDVSCRAACFSGLGCSSAPIGCNTCK